MSLRLLSHFQFLQFTDQYWKLPAENKQDFQKKLLVDLEKSSLKFDLYQAYPLHADVDIIPVSYTHLTLPTNREV